jgi:hypothetical protein
LFFFGGLGRINVGISLGAFDAILMGVFWLNQKLGVGFVGMRLEDIIVDIDGYVVLVVMNCYGILSYIYIKAEFSLGESLKSVHVA